MLTIKDMFAAAFSKKRFREEDSNTVQSPKCPRLEEGVVHIAEAPETETITAANNPVALLADENAPNTKRDHIAESLLYGEKAWRENKSQGVEASCYHIPGLQKGSFLYKAANEILIPLLSRKKRVTTYSRISPDDVHLLIGKHVTLSNGYPQVGWTEDGISRSLALSTLIIGEPPEHKQIDYRDQHPLNNVRRNLCFLTRRGNSLCVAKKAGCSSKYKGVYWEKKEKKWRVCHRPGGRAKSKDLGWFEHEIHAAIAYNEGVKHEPSAWINRDESGKALSPEDSIDYVPYVARKSDEMSLGLPKGVSYSSHCLNRPYKVGLKGDPVAYFAKREDAIAHAEKVMQGRLTRREAEIRGRPITKKTLDSGETTAFITVNTKGKKLDVLVDDRDWHDIHVAGTLIILWSQKNTRCNVGLNMKMNTSFNPKNEEGSYLLHRWLLGMTDPKIEVDHRSRDTLDNRRKNLREDPGRSLQGQNVLRQRVCKYAGVRVSGSRVSAEIKYKGKYYYLGAHKTQEEAGVAYDKKALEFYGADAKLNFPSSIRFLNQP